MIIMMKHIETSDHRANQASYRDRVFPAQEHRLFDDACVLPEEAAAKGVQKTCVGDCAGVVLWMADLDGPIARHAGVDVVADESPGRREGHAGDDDLVPCLAVCRLRPRINGVADNFCATNRPRNS